MAIAEIYPIHNVIRLPSQDLSLADDDDDDDDDEEDDDDCLNDEEEAQLAEELFGIDMKTGKRIRKGSIWARAKAAWRDYRLRRKGLDDWDEW